MFPVTRSANRLPYELPFHGPTVNMPLLLLFAGWAFRIHSQKKPALTVWVPHTLDTVSLTLGMYLLAYRPEEGPPASKPPGLKISAASAPPQLPNDGICATPFLYRPW